MAFRYHALKLCGIVGLVFLIQLMVPGFTVLFDLTPVAFLELWRFASAIFLHGSLMHLLFNGLALALFGSVLEKLIGGRKFLLVFFATGILANFISVYFYPASLGASGAIFGVIGALIVIRPLLFVWAFGIPMPIFIAGILWSSFDLLGAIGYLTGNPLDSTGNIAHLSGMFFGLIFGAFFRGGIRVRKRMNYGLVMDERVMRNWEERYLR